MSISSHWITHMALGITEAASIYQTPRLVSGLVKWIAPLARPPISVCEILSMVMSGREFGNDSHLWRRLRKRSPCS